MNERIENYLKLFLIDNNFEKVIAKIDDDNKLITYYGITNKEKLIKIKEKLEKIVGSGIISEVQNVENESRKFFIKILDINTFEKKLDTFVKERYQNGKDYWEVKILEQSKDTDGNVYDVYMNTFRFKEKIDAIVFSKLYDEQQVVSIQKITVFNLKI